MNRGVFLMPICLCYFIFIITGFSCSNESRVKNIYTCPCDSGLVAKIQYKGLYLGAKKYDSKLVEIEGYYIAQFEQSALFRSNNRNNKSAIWIDFNTGDSLKDSKSGAYLFSSSEETNKINGKRIKIRGVFDFNLHGHLDEYFGEIKRICYLETL